MIVIGLTGGIASGKSYVASLLAEHGATVLDADRYARAALDEPAVREALVARWGESVLTARGAVDRAAIAERVFGDSPGATEERRFLEGLVHPRVREALRSELEAARQRGATAAVLDIPLLLEAGWRDECDLILFVDTPDEVRLHRAAGRGWDAAELRQREAAQAPLAEKRRLADRVLPGDDAAATAAAVAAFWREAIEPPPAAPRSGG